ncbi:MAG: LytTR family DNA-binding domain-containing protein [Aerococcus sp.]|nr:LytTR family DNA-binding domain-containing protein [Aerococcus sp.]
MRVTSTFDHQVSPDELHLLAREKTPSVERIINFAEREIFRLVGQHNEENVYIELSHIQQIYAANKHVYCYAEGKEYLLNERLYQLIARLPQSFVQISRSELVQLAFIERFKFTKNGIIEIQFKDGQKTSVSRRYFQRIKEVLNHV